MKRIFTFLITLVLFLGVVAGVCNVSAAEESVDWTTMDHDQVDWSAFDWSTLDWDTFDYRYLHAMDDPDAAYDRILAWVETQENPHPLFVVCMGADGWCAESAGALLCTRAAADPVKFLRDLALEKEEMQEKIVAKLAGASYFELDQELAQTVAQLQLDENESEIVCRLLEDLRAAMKIAWTDAPPKTADLSLPTVATAALVLCLGVALLLHKKYRF